jgi:hypothetical protein
MRITTRKGAGMRAINWWTYEADVWCASCAYERFGEALHDEDTLDGEGNHIHPVFGWEEGELAGMPCGGCDAVVGKLFYSCIPLVVGEGDG